MIQAENSIISELVRKYPVLDGCKSAIMEACRAIAKVYRRQGTLFICGNGGSCSDADHIVGELMKGFRRKRPASSNDKERLAALPDGAYLAEKLQQGLPAVSLHSQTSLLSAVANDLGGDMGYAQHLYAQGRSGDVLLGISTSGNARNVFLASQVARIKDICVIGLTGRRGGILAEFADISIRVPEDETYKVQELHLPVYHAICSVIEDEFFPL